MKLWLDSIDLPFLKEVSHLIGGVTTNPGILASSTNILETLEKLLVLQKGPVAVQVTAKDSISMVNQAKMLFSFSKRIVVKIPVTNEGLLAIHMLKKTKIPLLATGVLTASQALLALQLDVEYIALYVKYMESPLQTVEEIVNLCKKTDVNLMAAAIADKKMLTSCMHLGCSIATIKEPLLKELLQEETKTVELTDKLLDKFYTSHSSLEKLFKKS